MTDPGQLLFFGYAKKDINCARCHGPEGEGGMQAPDIRKALQKYTKAEIFEIIREGKGLGDDAMPPLGAELSDRELEHLYDYLKTLQSNEPAPE